MAVAKKYIFKISLLLIILSSVILCAYAIARYQGSTALSQNITDSGSDLKSEINLTSEIMDQKAGDGSQVSGYMDQTHGDQSLLQNGEQADVIYGWRGFEGKDSVGSKYAPYLLAYALLFLDISILAYFLLLRKKIKIDPGHANILMLTLLGSGLFLRIAAATLVDGQNDINIYKYWASAAANNFLQLYDGGSAIGYPPLYLYVLYLVGKIAAVPALSSYYMILLKLPSIAADVATAYLIYRLAGKYLSREISVILSAFYVFNPAVVINSTFWGQVDSFFTLIVVAALFLLAEKRTCLAAALFIAAVLMKPQGLIFMPVLFFELVRRKELKIILKAAAAALVTIAVIILPFSYNKGVLWLYNLFLKSTSENYYASVNAFNIYSLIKKNCIEDSAVLYGLSCYNWGMVFIVAVTMLAWFLYIKRKSSDYAPAAALLLITGVFNLSTRMHERYLFSAIALAILAYIYLKDKRFILLFAGYSATVYLNVHYVLFKTGGRYIFPYSIELIIISIMNLLLLFYLGKVLYDIAVRKNIKLLM